MARFYPVGGAGGIASLDFVTAEAGDILGGKVGADKDGEPVNGLLVLSGNAAASDVSSGKTFYTTDPKSKQTGTLKECGQAQTAGGWGSGGSGSDAYFAMNRIPEGIYRSGGTDWGPEVRMKQSDVRSAIGATNPANWRSTITIAGLKGTMPQQGGSTTTPGTGNKTIVFANRFVTGNIIVAGDADLKAANIKKGVNIFGVTGTFEGYIAGPADLYNKGNNAKNVRKYQGQSSIEFQSGFIYAKLSPNRGVALTSDAINTTGYSKLNVHFLSDTKLDANNASILSLTTAANGEGNTIAEVRQELGSGEKTFTLSFTHAANAYLKLSLAATYNVTSSNYRAYIDRIWLS